MKPPAAQSSPAAAAAAGECGTPKAPALRKKGRPAASVSILTRGTLLLAGSAVLRRRAGGPLTGASPPNLPTAPGSRSPPGDASGGESPTARGKSSAASISWVTFGRHPHAAEAQFPRPWNGQGVEPLQGLVESRKDERRAAPAWLSRGTRAVNAGSLREWWRPPRGPGTGRPRRAST